MKQAMAANQFSEVMRQRSDAELLEIVTVLKDDYQPEAVTAATHELESRNLSSEALKMAEHELQQKQIATEEKANTPLDLKWKVLCLLFPGIMNLFLAFIFMGQGHKRKFKEAWGWTLYGFGFYFGLVMLMALLVGLLD